MEDPGYVGYVVRLLDSHTEDKSADVGLGDLLRLQADRFECVHYRALKSVQRESWHEATKRSLIIWIDPLRSPRSRYVAAPSGPWQAPSLELRSVGRKFLRTWPLYLSASRLSQPASPATFRSTAEFSARDTGHRATTGMKPLLHGHELVAAGDHASLTRAAHRHQEIMHALMQDHHAIGIAYLLQLVAVE